MSRALPGYFFFPHPGRHFSLYLTFSVKNPYFPIQNGRREEGKIDGWENAPLPYAIGRNGLCGLRRAARRHTPDDTGPAIRHAYAGPYAHSRSLGPVSSPRRRKSPWWGAALAL